MFSVYSLPSLKLVAKRFGLQQNLVKSILHIVNSSHNVDIKNSLPYTDGRKKTQIKVEMLVKRWRWLQQSSSKPFQKEEYEKAEEEDDAIKSDVDRLVLIVSLFVPNDIKLVRYGKFLCIKLTFQVSPSKACQRIGVHPIPTYW